MGEIVPQLHLSLWGRGRGEAAGEGAFLRHRAFSS
jgi:hypothetical protein